MAVDFRKKLKEANKLWKGAKKQAAEKSSNFESEFEDGRYMARLQGGEIGTSDAGRLQLVWSWKFEEDDDHKYGGKIKKAYQGLETEANLVFLARDLERLGYEAPDDLAGVEEILADIKKEKPLARIRLKTKGDFQNVYIDKVFGNDDEDEDEDEDEEAGDATESEEEEESDEEESEDDSEEESEDDEEAESEEEEEEEADDEEGEEVEVQVGMKVKVNLKDGETTGEVTEVLEDEGKLRITTKDGRKVKVGVDKVEMIAPEEPEAKPKKKAAAAEAPAKKKSKK